MTKKCIYSILILFLLCPSWAAGQEAAHGEEAYTPVVAGPDDKMINEMKVKLQEYIADINDLVIAVSVFPIDSLPSLQRSYKIVDSKWQTYYQAVQMDIATSDELLELVARYQIINQAASEALGRLGNEAEAKQSFLKAKDFIVSKSGVYKKMYKEAMALQMIKQLAPQLEKLKAKEQVIFGDVEAHYQQARTAVATDSSLAKSLSRLDNYYFEIKTTSTAIQAAVYKPFIERIKEKLMIAAAMAIIMMFVTMIGARLQALKKAHDMAKKFKSQLQNNQDYPTI